VSGTESVRVGSMGSVVELSGAGDVEYVSYVWRSSSSFDEYENRFETMSGVTEVVVRSVSADGARVLSSSGGGSLVHMDLSSSSSWERVWSSTVGHGSYSLDGLHVRFDMMDVSGMRLGASPRSSPSFDGWSEVMLHFGRSVESGSVSVSASSVLEAVSGESVSVSSQSVSVSAGSSLDVSGGDSVSVVSEAISVESGSSMEVSSVRASVSVGESLDVFSGGSVAVTSSSARLDSSGDVSVTSGSAVSLSGASASVEVSDLLEVSSEEMSVRAGARVSARIDGRDRVARFPDWLCGPDG